ncbi:hypothetical protein NP493_642g00048 [Ridgeia piscesae]|uniref:Uncharacterized protein n=1 Tax=Ridgeia piscesae TaxID=27915 RepID=A0AAD9NRH0_RIDPI|nr:hypothetical protein NP493_642g00048 [Ridgeia piscesae]
MQGPTQPPVGGPGGRFNIVVIQNQSSVVRTNYRQKPSYLLGVIQVSTGILCVIFQSVEDALGGSGSTGIGAGIFFLITGILCFWAGKARTSCSIISVIALSIFSLLLAISLMNAAGHGVANHSTTIRLMNILLIILAAIEGIAAFISTWLGCSSMCGRQIDSHGVVLSQPNAVMVNTGANYTPGLPPGHTPVGNIYPGQQQGQMPVGNMYPVQQSAMPAYGFQPQYMPQSAPMFSPNPPPEYSVPSQPPPSYSAAVPTAPPTAPPVDH